jgi:hypothetical protein
LRTGSRLGSLRGSCTVLFLLVPISSAITPTPLTRGWVNKGEVKARASMPRP